MAIGASYPRRVNVLVSENEPTQMSNAVVAVVIVVEAVGKCIIAKCGGYALTHQPGLAYGLPVLARPTGALGVAGVRPVAGTGDNQHLSFVTEAVEPGRGQQWVQEDIRPLRRGAIGS